MYRFLIAGSKQGTIVNIIHAFKKKRPTSDEVIEFIKTSGITINSMYRLEVGDSSKDSEVTDPNVGMIFRYRDNDYITVKSINGCNGCVFSVVGISCTSIPRPRCSGIIFKLRS